MPFQIEKTPLFIFNLCSSNILHLHPHPLMSILLRRLLHHRILKWSTYQNITIWLVTRVGALCTNECSKRCKGQSLYELQVQKGDHSGTSEKRTSKKRSHVHVHVQQTKIIGILLYLIVLVYNISPPPIFSCSLCILY